MVTQNNIYSIGPVQLDAATPPPDFLVHGLRYAAIIAIICMLASFIYHQIISKSA